MAQEEPHVDSLVTWAHASSVHTSQIPSCFVGQPILAAAGFQPALFVSRFVGFCRKRRSRQGSAVTRVNASVSPLPGTRLTAIVQNMFKGRGPV